MYHLTVLFILVIWLVLISYFIRKEKNKQNDEKYTSGNMIVYFSEVFINLLYTQGHILK